MSGGGIARLYGIDGGWTRPVDVPRALRVDLVLTCVLVLGAAASIETARSLGSLDTTELGTLGTYLWILVPVTTLALRRVAPLTVLGVALVHYVVTAVGLPEVSPVFALQVYYFFALFSAIAWARHRLAALVMTLLTAAASAFWVVAELLLHDALDTLAPLPVLGLFSPPVAALLQVALSSLTFFLAASLGGLAAWWSAQREARAREQAVTIATQADQLRQRSVIEERLRIARELHDVIGHHVSLIGIQAAAARAVLRTSPDDATTALQVVEQVSRSATRDLRLLLNALRVQQASEADLGATADLDELQHLLETYEAFGLEVSTRTEGEVDAVPGPAALAAYRLVQEALTNVVRHSQADAATVTFTVTERTADAGVIAVEVRDPGPARDTATSGSRMGLVGMRERVEIHDGDLHAAPTEEGGFVVNARLRWDATTTRP
ncbi:sensor histidine kinase [Nocardioides sp. CPCC 205120]|uniref:sensor histidine kinase n=1 Tax=Nocardioides sp. CPCC 205120 TaxID=3406462 RepID=UPI003B50EB4A